MSAMSVSSLPILSAYIVPHPPLLVPAVGRGEEKKIAATAAAMRAVAEELGAAAPDTLILISPHAVCYADYIHISPGAGASGDLSAFRAPEVKISVSYDEQLAGEIAAAAERRGLPAGLLGEKSHSLDHATIVPLFFIRPRCPAARIVRIGLSGLSPLDHYQFGEAVREAAGKLGRRAAVIASGDLSHRLKESGPYGFSPEGPVFDREVTEAMREGDFGRFLKIPEALADGAGECGLRSFQIMAGILDGLAVEPRLLSYEGPFGVGYAVAAFRVTGEDPRRAFGEKIRRERLEKAEKERSGESEPVRLARLSLESRVREGRAVPPPPGTSPEWLRRRAGVFVSLKKEGRLRGCIGTILPTEPSVAEEILANAVKAGTEDPRFPPVSEKELPLLVYSVDVLSRPEPIDSPARLDPSRYGVIVSCGFRRGLLLPMIEGVDTAERQIEIARNKGNIRADEPYRLERFEVVRYQ